MFKVRNLTEAEARECAAAAAWLFKEAHVALQLRNGRWKWARLSWHVAVKLMVNIPLRFQVYGADGQPLKGKCYAKI